MNKSKNIAQSTGVKSLINIVHSKDINDRNFKKSLSFLNMTLRRVTTYNIINEN